MDKASSQPLSAKLNFKRNSGPGRGVFVEGGRGNDQRYAEKLRNEGGRGAGFEDVERIIRRGGVSRETKIPITTKDVRESGWRKVTTQRTSRTERGVEKEETDIVGS